VASAHVRDGGVVACAGPGRDGDGDAEADVARERLVRSLERLGLSPDVPPRGVMAPGAVLGAAGGAGRRLAEVAGSGHRSFPDCRGPVPTVPSPADVSLGVTGCARVASWLPVESAASFPLWVGTARAAVPRASRLLDGAAVAR